MGRDKFSNTGRLNPANAPRIVTGAGEPSLATIDLCMGQPFRALIDAVDEGAYFVARRQQKREGAGKDRIRANAGWRADSSDRLRQISRSGPVPPG